MILEHQALLQSCINILVLPKKEFVRQHIVSSNEHKQGETTMALISLRQLLDHAAEQGYGVPAFNINNMEQGLAIMKAAAKLDAPVILQASRGARTYAGDPMLRAMVTALAEMFPDIPVVLHQDHGNNEATCLTAIQHGFTSVMMDGSLEADAKTPASYDYNVDITKRVTDMAHAVGASVEGELGVLGSLETGEGEKEDGHGFEGKLSEDELLTDPDQAVDFVRQTGVDALAIAMGTSHGAYKFSRKPDGEILAMHVVEAINKKLPNTHLVMHGSSSVPQELQELFNEFGGDIPQTYGVPVEEIERGIRCGVRKVNIDTDCRLAMTAAFRRVASENLAEFDPRKFLIPAMDAMEALVADRFERFGCAGNASKIKPIGLSEMAAMYASGKL
jgi:fructose-bisphosphate aldolase class II